MQSTVHVALIEADDGTWHWLTAEFADFGVGTLARVDSGVRTQFWAAFLAVRQLYPQVPAFGGPDWVLTQPGTWECRFEGTM